MKSWLIVTLTWTILVSSALIANGITLDLVNKTKAGYSTFLAAIRDDVKDPKLNYGGTGIPVIGAPTTTFLRIDLATSNGTVSLGLERSSLYVITFLVKNNNSKSEAYYFKDKITSAQLDKLFPEAKGAANQIVIKEYEENYASLGKAARKSRKSAGLGIDKLIGYIGKVNGWEKREVQAEATFLLVAIQMVSEAARFGYIEKAVLDNNFPNGFTPDDKVIILERNWERISQAIKDSTNGVFKTPLILKNLPEVKTTWTVKDATELNMKLLKFLGRKCPSESSFQANHTNHGTVAVI